MANNDVAAINRGLRKFGLRWLEADANLESRCAERGVAKEDLLTVIGSAGLAPTDDYPHLRQKLAVAAQAKAIDPNNVIAILNALVADLPALIAACQGN